jgi:hypothetical protein
MIRFNRDRNKIISDIGNELIEYNNNVLLKKDLSQCVPNCVGVTTYGKHTVHLTDKVYNDFVSHIGEYESVLDIFPQYDLSMDYDSRCGRGSALSPKLTFHFRKRERD